KEVLDFSESIKLYLITRCDDIDIDTVNTFILQTNVNGARASVSCVSTNPMVAITFADSNLSRTDHPSIHQTKGTLLNGFQSVKRHKRAEYDVLPIGIKRLRLGQYYPTHYFSK
ncbi:unnamed protein product, partial [Ceratitis capitata]